MTTEQTWDTDEVERWIDNDSTLYYAINGKDLNAGQIKELVLETKRIEPAMRFDSSLVSWSHLRDTYREEEE